ncbi:hypothetical protein SAMN02799631_04343 [Methylobacterium sp. 174MFSha1.1]|uniref:hypothetical protein n=1 Tax=Methylobacterium sp. 174MFSha1.1 TaxID=1502749 RepID=UPI0008DF1A14|nr:hypothetical protein [Methylobacterium sp. 174MFSha1.1]SFV06048.1 hypothetical protein SAMN02799631_04343 [Methylobacterium sp. 174MFSha1.1]
MRPIRMLVADEVDPYPPGILGGPIVLTPAQQAFIERRRAMRLREKGKTDGEPVTMGWDEAQAALAAGTHEVAEGSDTGGGDAPAAENEAGAGADQGKQVGDTTKAKTEADKGQRAAR